MFTQFCGNVIEESQTALPPIATIRELYTGRIEAGGADRVDKADKANRAGVGCVRHGGTAMSVFSSLCCWP